MFAAGKPSFFRDRVVIKYGQMGCVMDSYLPGDDPQYPPMSG
jgi:hypothetical protein